MEKYVFLSISYYTFSPHRVLMVLPKTDYLALKAWQLNADEKPVLCSI